MVNGADVIEDRVKAAYRRAGMGPTFIDDYLSHLVGGGKIHCGSNTLRDTDLEWWGVRLRMSEEYAAEEQGRRVSRKCAAGVLCRSVSYEGITEVYRTRASPRAKIAT